MLAGEIMRLYNRVLTTIFIAFLVIFNIFNIIAPDKVFSEEENRMLEKKPEFSWDDLISGKFTSKYEKYVTDQFAYRDIWVSIKSASEILLQKKDNNGVYMGSNGYLLQKPVRVNNDLLEKNIAALNKFAYSLGEMPVYFLLAPNSAEILSDKLPPYATVNSDIIEQVKNKLNSEINFIDVYDSLKDHSNEYIYFKTDHHWTQRGAYYAYLKASNFMGFSAIDIKDFNIETVSESFYGTLYSKSGIRFVNPDCIEILKPEVKADIKVEYIDTNKTSNSLYETSHLKSKDKYSVFLDGNHALVKISTNLNTGKKLLVIKDSYAHSLVPLLTNHYDEIHMIDLRYFNMNIPEYIEQNALNEVLFLYNNISFNDDSTIVKLGL